MAMPVLEKQMCELAHVNLHVEMHGEQKVPVIDLKWVTQVAPSFLDSLVPEMREHFFKPSNSSGAIKGELQVRCPELGVTFKVDRDIPGYTLLIDTGAISGAYQQHGLVKLRNQQVKLIDGGAIEYTFFTQLHGDPHSLKETMPLLGMKLPVTLSPPESEPLPKGHPDSEESRKAAQKAIDKAKGIGKATNAENGAAAAGNGPEQQQPEIGNGAPPTDDQFKGSDLAAGAIPPAPAGGQPAPNMMDKMSDDARKAAAKSPQTKPPKPGMH